ncbi:MAG: carbohydrate ABC transporter permease [Candidatus Promineifilaceae bacterium]
MARRAKFGHRPFRRVAQAALALLFLLPLVWMLAAALHPPGVPLPNSLRLLPEDATLENFGRVADFVPVGRYALNSLLVVALAVPLTVLTSSWAGFAMAGLPRASQQRWLAVSLVVLMVPGIALWSTRFVIYKQLGWLDSVWALIAPAWMGTSPFYVLMFYRAFRRLPAAFFDAARIDGAGVLQTWARVAMPLARATAGGVALLSFILYWSDFISPLLYLRSEANYTLPIALQLLQQLTRSDWGVLMAGALIASALPLALFLLAQPLFGRASD